MKKLLALAILTVAGSGRAWAAGNDDALAPLARFAEEKAQEAADKKAQQKKDFALRYAIYNDDPAEVRRCLGQGANADAEYRDVAGTPLLEAVVWRRPERRHQREIVKLLVDHGADVNKPGERGETALGYAAGRQDPELVRFLLDHRANPNPPDNEEHDSPLITAVRMQGSADKNRIRIIELLVGAGAEVNKQDEAKQTPLIIAAGYGNTVVVKILLEHGADPNKQGQLGYTALMQAAIYGYADKEMVGLLLSHGADVNLRKEHAAGSAGETALMIAAGHNDHPEVLGALMGSNVDAVDDFGRTALMEAARSLGVGARENKREYADRNVEELLKLGADPNRMDSRGETALMRTARTGAFKSAELLIEHGADVTAASRYGETALTVAQRKILAGGDGERSEAYAKNYDRIVTLLKQHGAAQ